jgi:hypothetical protein
VGLSRVDGRLDHPVGDYRKGGGGNERFAGHTFLLARFRPNRYDKHHSISYSNVHQLDAMAASSGPAGKSFHCFCDVFRLISEFVHSASLNDVLQLTGSLINICYNHQRRKNRNASINPKQAIDSLRSLNGVLHSLYTAVDDEDLNGSSQPSSVPALMLISKENDTLVLCTAELRTLEKFLEAGDGPLDHAGLKKTLDNLRGIKVAFDVTVRLDEIFNGKQASKVLTCSIRAIADVTTNPREIGISTYHVIPPI